MHMGTPKLPDKISDKVSDIFQAVLLRDKLHCVRELGAMFAPWRISEPGSEAARPETLMTAVKNNNVKHEDGRELNNNLLEERTGMDSSARAPDIYAEST